MPRFQLRKRRDYKLGEFSGFDRENTKTALTPFMMHKALDNYFDVLIKSGDFDKDKWVDAKIPDKIIKMLKNKDDYATDPAEQFDPFIQKLVLSEKSQIALIGDRHADIHSFIKIIEDLINEHFLDHQNLKINVPNFYMIFHGDFTDRGWYGLEVVLLILALKHANPNNVFMSRGNHEEGKLNKKESTNSFFHEIEKKFPPTLWDKALACIPFYQRLNTSQKIFHKICKMYETLPLAIFTGCQDTEKNETNYAVCCHGGLEFGFNPLPLYEHHLPRSFIKLGSLDRAAQLKKMSQNQTTLDKFKKVTENSKKPIESSEDLKKNFQGTIVDQDRLDFMPTGIISQIYQKPEGSLTAIYSEGIDENGSTKIGFQWNDLEVSEAYEKQNIFVKSTEGRGLQIGKTFNGAVLAGLYSNERHKARVLFRAHQHTDYAKNPMMQRILNTDCCDHDVNKGIGRLWLPENVKSLPPTRLWDNCACTLNVAPQTPYQKVGFSFDSYGLLTLNTRFEDWQLEVVNVSVKEDGQQ